VVGRVGVEPTTKRLRGSFDPRQPDEDELKNLYFRALTESGVRLASVRSAASGSSLVADERRAKASLCGNDAPYYYSGGPPYSLLARATLSNLWPASGTRPLSVNRYFCDRLLGLSGSVISINPAANVGTR
jgi:hypothetical protein